MTDNEILTQIYAEIRLWENILLLPNQIEKANSLQNTISILNLSMMGIHRVPLTVRKLNELHSLFLMNNRLEYLPELICSLRKLRYLNVFDNRLKNIPDNIGNLTDLLQLDLGRNNIEYLPKSIGNLGNLQRLSIENNLLKELPSSFINLTSLKVVYLYGNPLDPDREGTVEILDYMKENYGTIFYIDKFIAREIYERKYDSA